MTRFVGVRWMSANEIRALWTGHVPNRTMIVVRRPSEVG